MFWHKREPKVEDPPWTVEYRLRLLHMPVADPLRDYDMCSGCDYEYSECPTLEILDKYGS